MIDELDSVWFDAEMRYYESGGFHKDCFSVRTPG